MKPISLEIKLDCLFKHDPIVEAKPGSDLRTAIESALVLALCEGRTTLLIFNGVKYRIDPDLAIDRFFPTPSPQAA